MANISETDDSLESLWAFDEDLLLALTRPFNFAKERRHGILAVIKLNDNTLPTKENIIDECKTTIVEITRRKWHEAKIAGMANWHYRYRISTQRGMGGSKGGKYSICQTSVNLSNEPNSDVIVSFL